MKKVERKTGFTLIELLAVMAVISILVSIVIGISGYASYKSDEAKTKAEIEKIRQLLQQYRAEHGVLPKNADFRSTIKDLDETFYEETNDLEDPWGNPYEYDRKSKYVAYVWSRGPDGDNKTKDDVGDFPPN